MPLSDTGPKTGRLPKVPIERRPRDFTPTSSGGKR